MLAALALAGAATEGRAQVGTWQGTLANGNPGDGFLWSNPWNWDGDVLPMEFENAIFGNGTPGRILLNGRQAVNGLDFTQNFTLGTPDDTNVLNLTGFGGVTVSTGRTATIHSRLNSPFGLSLSGGGMLYLTNRNNDLGTGAVTIEGVGTTLMMDMGGLSPQVNATGGVQLVGRQNGPRLGISTTARSINLQNGGQFKMIGSGANPDGTTFNFSFTGGEGILNVASTFQQLNLDDANQLSGFADMVKDGKGRLSLLSQDYNYSGNVIINGGILDLNRTVAVDDPTNADPAVTITRFSSLAGTLMNSLTNTLTINNGGTLMINGGGGAQLDLPSVVANNGAIIGVQGGDVEIGLRINQGENNLTINGTVRLLSRDLFNTQQERLPRLHSDLLGDGVLEVHPNTNSGGNPRLVLERATAESTFNGTFRLMENQVLEANPRFNPTVNVGSVMASGDTEFAGWGSRIDVRDNGTGSSQVLNYNGNDLSVTSTQAGTLNRVTVNFATANTGNLFHFGALNLGNHRFAVDGANSYQLGFANTGSIRGNALIEMRTDNVPLVFTNAVALSEDAAGRSLTLVKTGVGNAAARDVISGGLISVSNLEVATGTLQLRGATGAIGTAFGGAAPIITVNGGANNFTNGLPTQGLLHLDSNTGHLVGSTTLIAADNNNNRIVDSATLNMRSNSILRLTSRAALQTTETIGTTNVSGHATFDVVKNGVAPAPIALTFNTLNMGTNATANFTGGAALGLAGTDTTRIIVPSFATGFLPSQFHVANEWAKYTAADSDGFQLGVTPFVASDYTINQPETTWAPGQQIKINTAAATILLTANRNIDRLNSQFTGTGTTTGVNVNGFVLTMEQGGILSSGSTMGFFDSATTPSIGGITAGTTTPGKLYVHNNSQIDLRVPVIDNLGANGVIGGGDDSTIDFIKSGTGTMRLTHQSLGVGSGSTAINPFTAPTWTSTFTGSWIINDGRLDVHRGQFLGGRPVVLNGGHLEINEPVANANADGIIPGWGNNIVVNGNATVAADDNGESSDGNTGDRALVKLGSLTINNGATLGISAFSEQEIAFMNGGNFSGTPVINTGIGRGNANQTNIISGVLAGSGFDLVGYNGGAAFALGGAQGDATNNTYDGTVTVYAGTLRLNKANGFDAITDGTVAEDLIINGGTLAWGPGQHGDLSTTNNFTTQNNAVLGLHQLSPAATLAAGQNQIEDTATVTLLSGTLGEGDRINVDTFGTLNQRNGTVNVGMGALGATVGNIAGGALTISPGGSFTAGTLNLQVGAYNPNITTGLPGDPTKPSVLEIGSGGLSMTGQTLIIGSGSNGSIAGAGAVLRLGGNVTVVDDPLLGNSGNQGIFVQVGNSFRELGNSRTDLMGGNRAFNIDEDVQFYVTTRLTNGGVTKNGGGALILQPYLASDFTGPVVVNSGVLAARADAALGTSAGGVTVNSGGTLKLEGTWTYGDAFTLNGPGAIIPGSGFAREPGALVAEAGRSRLTGTVELSGDATIASNGTINPSATPAGGAFQFWTAELSLENAGGISGTGTLTLAGLGDGTIAGGLGTVSGGLSKEGSGRWTLSGASTYGGSTTISAGRLQIGNGGSLGSTALGTTVFGGGTLELSGGITVAEPLVLHGVGAEILRGALSNFSGNNIQSGAITLGSDSTVSSYADTLTLNGAISSAAAPSANRTLTLTGSSTGVINGAITTGSGGLIKSGRGTWTLAGGNTFTGATTLAGGNLVLNYATNNAGKVSVSNPLVLSGGNLQVQGNAGAATTQSVGGLVIGKGGGSIAVANGAGQSATLNLGAITRDTDPFLGTPLAGGAVNFVLPTTGAITTSTGLVNGILGGYATVGANWATRVGANIAPFTAYTTFDPTGITGLSDNPLITGITRVNGFVATNSLKVGTGGGIALDFNNLTLSSGGLIYDGAGTARITGSGGLISGVTSQDELYLHTASGTLDVGAQLIGFGSGNLTKTGAGTLVLRNVGSGFTGSVNINAGNLVINGAGGGHPTALGSQSGNRDININGGTFTVRGGYDLNIAGGQMQLVAGASGATIASEFGGTTDNNGSIIINDAQQLSGSGDLTYTGGGRLTLGQGSTGFADFLGNIIVQSGILNLLHPNAAGGRAEQTITLRENTALINQVASGIGVTGLANNLILEANTTLFSQGGNRAYLGTVQLNGPANIVLTDRDNTGQQRDVHLMGKVSGTGVALNVVGSHNANPLYLSSASNDFTGSINLGTNATLEARQGGSLGQGIGDVTVNLNGANSRLLLRHWQNADFRANVVVNQTAEISADRLANYGGGSGQQLSVNNLTVNGGEVLQFGGGNAFIPRVAGTATFNASPILSVTNNVLFENGIQFSPTSGNTLLKRGGGALILKGPATQTGSTIIQTGVVDLRGADGSLPNTSSIELRGGELRVENGDAINLNRLNTAGSLIFGGGTLRVNGDQNLPATVGAVAGNTIVIFNPASETVTSALTFNNFTRALGATMHFQVAENGGAAVGALNLGNVRTTPRIIVPALTDTGTTTVVPGMYGNNGLDFLQYDGTTLNGGVALGLRELRNPTPLNSPTYSNNLGEGAWTETVVNRLTTAQTLTSNRVLDAIKVEAAIAIDTAGFNLRVENGILGVGNAVSLNGATGTLTAGSATPGITPAELFLSSNNTLTVNTNIVDNGTQPVALVKTGTGTVTLASPTSTFTGGIYHNSGTLTVSAGTALGSTSNTIRLAGGLLNLFTGNANSGETLPGFGQNIAVTSNNSAIVVDNGSLAGTDNDYNFGNLSIAGPYTLQIRGFDSEDLNFTSSTFTGSPTLDLNQANAGGNATVVTLGGVLSGTGLNVMSTGNSANTAALLNIGSGDSVPNTYTGRLVTVNNFPAQQNDPRIFLNKANGTTAITGDVELNAGTLTWNADDQMADTGKILLNFGSVDFLGRNETIGGLTMRGGLFRTNSAGTTATTINTVTIQGDAEIFGASNTFATDAFTTNSNSTMVVTGTLKLHEYGRAIVGANNGTLVLGGLEMNGTVLQQNADTAVNAPNIVRLNGDVKTFAANFPALLGNSNDAETFLELTGNRTFDIADGPVGIDISVSTAIRDNSVTLAPGGFIKTGAGTMQLQGGGSTATYTGATLINEGSVVLFKSTGVAAFGTGPLTIGDGVGGNRADKVISRNSNQLNGSSAVTIASSGVLDLETFNTSERIPSLAGTGAVDLGPTSVLTVSGSTDSVFTGTIIGGGGVTKEGVTSLEISGANDYFGPTNVTAGDLVVRGAIGGVTVNFGANLSPGAGPTLLNSRGNLDLQSGAGLKIELGGNTPGTGYDQINVTGTINLAGDLQGSLINGFLPATQDLFFLMVNDGVDAVNGAFNNLPEGSFVNIGGFNFMVTYTANFEGVPSQFGGNDIALAIPEPGAAVSLLAALGPWLGLGRFRRRRD